MQVGAGPSKKNRPSSGISHNEALYCIARRPTDTGFCLCCYLVLWIQYFRHFFDAVNGNALKLNCELLRNFVTGDTELLWFW